MENKLAATKRVIHEHSITARKRFGQNFLTDSHVLEQIVEGAGVTKDDVVLEIGPGLGTLTAELAKCANSVIAVEIDRDLVGVLAKTLQNYNNIEIIEGDILKLDLDKEIRQRRADHAGPIKLKVVANLPYYITTPIITKLLEQEYTEIIIMDITVMVQREVAKRMTASPSSKDYGSLSVSVQYFTNPAIVIDVPPEAFTPSPKVSSAVVHLSVYKEKPIKARSERLFFDLVTAAFAQRRKTLLNCIHHNLGMNWSKEEIADILSATGFDVNIRGEALFVSDFVKLADYLFEIAGNK